MGPLGVTPLPLLGVNPSFMPLEMFEAPTTASELFCEGNEKLGAHVLTFSLPAIFTCTGSSGVCRTLCYVIRPQSHFNTDMVRDRYWQNWNTSLQPDFTDIVVAAYKRLKRQEILTRLHVSGDFYDAVYANKWLDIMKAVPQSTFWFYTRAWRDPVVRPVVEKMASLPNVQAWYSCDTETGRPDQVPARVRLSYLMIHERDIPSYAADLYFRDRSLVNSIAKSVAGTLVCPAENGVTRTTCERCRVCLTEISSDGARRTRDRVDTRSPTAA